MVKTSMFPLMWPVGRPEQGLCWLDLLMTSSRLGGDGLAGSHLGQAGYFTQNVFVECGKLGTQVPEFKF